jgi:aryl-alcohol dehydrogenase-like predicted oxidoreductase
VQIYWSLVGRESEHEIVPTCDRLGIGVVVWSPLAGGYLSGRSDGRRSVWAFPPVDESVGARVLAALGQVAGELDVSVAQVALAWLLHRREVTSVIIGASSPAQLEQNLAAAEVRLDGFQLDRLSQASAIVPTYPTWWDAAMGVPSRREG